MKNKKYAVLSLSGGMDSSTLLLHLLAEGYEVTALSFNYGQKHNLELERAKELVEYVNLYAKNVLFTFHNIIEIKGLGELLNSSLVKGGEAVPEGHYAEANMKSTVVPNRNKIFASITQAVALSVATQNKSKCIIALGVHSGDHCFSKNTNILTPQGLKTINTLKEGDLIYSYNLEQNIWELDTLQKVWKKNIVDKVNIIQTTSGKLELTDEHEVYTLKLGDFHNTHGYKKEIIKKKVKDLVISDRLVQPSSLYNRTETPLCNLYIDFPTIAQNLLQNYNNLKSKDIVQTTTHFGLGNKSDLYLSKNINIRDFVSVCAWYIAEGWSQKDPYNIKGSRSRFTASFCQSIKANLDKVEYIIGRLKTSNIPVKYEFSKTLHNGIPKDITFYFSNIMSLFLKECGSHSQIKRIPSWLFEILLQNQELREEFIRSITLGDGFNYNEQLKGFCTTSPILMEQMVTLLHLSGYSVSHDLKRKTETKYISFSKLGTKQAAVSLGQAKFSEIVSITVEDYNDHVYDLSVEKNHNFLAGEFGQLLISNSIYPDCTEEFRQADMNAFKKGNWESHLVDFYAPYMNGDKFTILQDGLVCCEKLGLDFDEVYKRTNTSYDPNEKGEASGKTGADVERVLAFHKLEKKDPVAYVDGWDKALEYALKVEKEFNQPILSKFTQTKLEFPGCINL